MRNKLFAWALMAVSLGSCALKYQKAITVSSADEILLEAAKRTSSALMAASKMSIGMTQKGPMEDESGIVGYQKLTFFTIYEGTEEDFTYAYYEKLSRNREEDEIFLSISGDESGIEEAYDVYSENPYSFGSEEEEKEYLEYGLSFGTEFLSFLVSYINMSTEYLTLLRDSLPNSLTDFGATSNGDGSLCLSYEGTGFSIPEFFGTDIFKSADIVLLKTVFDDYLLSEVDILYGEDEEGKISFYFEYE